MGNRHVAACAVTFNTKGRNILIMFHQSERDISLKVITVLQLQKLFKRLNEFSRRSSRKRKSATLTFMRIPSRHRERRGRSTSRNNGLRLKRIAVHIVLGRFTIPLIVRSNRINEVHSRIDDQRNSTCDLVWTTR